MIWLFACMDTPHPLPPSRLEVPTHVQMIEYSSLKSFLITKGDPQVAILWKGSNIDDNTKKCALSQMPTDSIALLLDNPDDIPLAKQYFHRYPIKEQNLSCPERP